MGRKKGETGMSKERWNNSNREKSTKKKLGQISHSHFATIGSKILPVDSEFNFLQEYVLLVNFGLLFQKLQGALTGYK